MRPDQEDTDSLPPYEILDPILKMLTEEMLDISQIEQKGYNINHVSKASQLLFKSEFKRFQSPPGPKITEKALEEIVDFQSLLNLTQIRGKI